MSRPARSAAPPAAAGAGSAPEATGTGSAPESAGAGAPTNATGEGPRPEAPAGGEFRFRHRVEVRFRDLDPMGHAHHSLILIYIEEARAAYWRAITGRREVDAIDYILGDVSIRFVQRVFYPAALDVGVRVARLGRSSFDMEYAVHGEDGALLATAHSTQIMYDYGAARSQPLPADTRARIARFEGLDAAG